MILAGIAVVGLSLLLLLSGLRSRNDAERLRQQMRDEWEREQ